MGELIKSIERYLGEEYSFLLHLDINKGMDIITQKIYLNMI